MPAPSHSSSQDRCRRRSRNSIALVTLAVLAVSVGAAAADAIRLEPFNARAYDAARASGLPFVIEFSADWCEPCRKLHEHTFTDPGVLREARGVRFLEVDMTKPDRQTELTMQSFRIPGAPTTLVFGPDGKEHTRRIGYIDAQEFVKLLRDAKATRAPTGPVERAI